MFEYKIKYLRSNDILASYEAAIQLLNSYRYHSIGQPVCVYYRDENDDVQTLYAIGKKDGSGNGSGTGYYDIINKVNVTTIYPQSILWKTIL